MSDNGSRDRSVGLVAGRWARALAAGAALVALLVGVPLALLAWGRWPITGAPGGEQIRDLPGTIASDSALIGVFTVALWLAWALFALCVAVEAAAEVRGRDLPWAVPAGPIRHVARSLVATVAVTVGSLGPVAASPLRPPPARPDVDAGTPAPAPLVSAVASHTTPAPAPAPAPPPAPGEAAPTRAAPGDTVTVVPGDTLWGLAARHLGDGTRWTEIWDANRGRAQPGGRTWDDPALLLPGWTLVVPAPAAGPTSLVSGVGRVADVVVGPDDNPWSLAERHLGDGTRWRELFALNRGRPQPGGEAWVTAAHIEPGWTLALPAPATAPPAQPAPPVVVSPPAATTAPEPDVAAEPAPPRPADPSEATEADPERHGEPGGDETPGPGHAPAAAAEAEGETASSGGADRGDGGAGSAEMRPVDPPTGAPPVQTAQVNDVDEAAGRNADDLDIAPVVVAGVSGLLATGVVLRLDAGRRRRMRRRRRGDPEPAVTAEDGPVERRWRAIADHESADWVDTAMRYLTWAVRSTGRPVAVVGARVGPAGFDLLLGAPAPEGAPRFDPSGGGWEWTLNCHDLDEIRAIAAEEAPYAPGLVTLGTAGDGSTVLIDVEHLGVTSVEGDPTVVRAWLTAVALDVATAPWASEVDLRLVGGLTDLAALAQVSMLDAGDVHRTIDRAVAATTRALGTHTSTQAARSGAGAEPWPPLTVIVSTAGVDQSLVDAAPRGRGAAVVAVGPVRATYRLAAGADGFATLFPFGLTVRLCAVDPQLASDTARLLTAAADPGDAPATPDVPPVPGTPTVGGAPGLPPVPGTPPGVAGRGSPASAPLFAPATSGAPPVDDEVRAKFTALTQAILQPAGVEVVVLGPPGVTGWATEPRQRSVEIVCYLASHDRPVSGDRLRDSIFPPGFKATSLREAMSRTRTALGRSANGDLHILPATREGSYELGPSVRSDLGRFQKLVAAARSAPAACEIELLRTALALVRGQPFGDCPPGGYGWASAEGISYALERAIVDAAQRLNELAFAAGDARLAEWASRQGQRAVPGHEGLYCDLALAKLRQDDVDGFTSVRREAEASAAAFDPLDGLQPETHEFFARVLARYKDLRDAAEGG